MAEAFRPNVYAKCDPTEVETSYVAGIIDGEGTISFKRQEGRNRNFYLTPILSVSNTDLPMVERLVEITGNGAIRLLKRLEKKHKTAYLWELSTSQIQRVLPCIEPFLVTKRERAQLVLEYFELQEKGRIEGSRGLSPGDLPRVQAIYDRMRELTHRGVDALPEVKLTISEPKKRDTTCQVEGCAQRQYRGELYCFTHWLEKREPVWDICQNCGGEMNVIKTGKQYCSPKCQAQAYRKNVTLPKLAAERACKKECPGCGEKFETREKGSMFCSKACDSRMQRAQTRAERLNLPIPQTYAEAVRMADVVRHQSCLLCGKHFETNNAKRVYCSQNCVLKASQRKRRAAEAAQRPIRECPECGTLVDRTGYKAKRFCSILCQQRNAKKRREKLA